MIKKEERYTREYLTGNFWKGTVDNDVADNEHLEVKMGEQLSLVDENGEICRKSIKYCLYRALKDFTDRTERKNDNTDSFGPIKKLDALGEDGFVKEFAEYFGQERCEKDFDAWHHGMCEEFLKVIQHYYKSDIQYGKAQKIVNMTFKNIYCLQNVDRYEAYFRYCHMPLDSIMLEWFYRAGQISKVKIRDKKVSRNYPSWSKLKYDNNPDGKYSYQEIQEWIRKYFCLSEKTDIKTQWTPLTAEFVLWKKIQFEFAAEGLYSQLIGLENDSEKDLKSLKKEFREKSVKEKKEFLDDRLQTIKYDFINVDFN